MTPFECLTEEEKSMINFCIEEYSDNDNSSGCSKAPLDYVLRFWNENKEHIFHKFGDKLNIEKEFKYQPSLEEIAKTIDSSDYYIINNFIRKCWDKLSAWELKDCKIYTILKGDDTKEKSLNWNDKNVISAIFNSNSSFLSNSCHPEICYSYDAGKRYFVELQDESSIEIVPGLKFNKLLKRIADSYGVEGYEEYRLAQSRVTNQKEVSGKLCLSIHPLDYITMSDNNSDWTSCMSWENYGEFRQGTVEMMNSPYVIVAYLKSENNFYKLDSGKEWNSKKWRLLIIASDDRIVSIKSYPYFNEALTVEALNFTKSIMTVGETWDDTLYILKSSKKNKVDTYGHVLSKEYPELISGGYSTEIMYNDFYTTVHFGYKFDAEATDLCPLNYSGHSECIWCGRDLLGYDFYDSESSLRCFYEGEINYCECCGGRIERDCEYWDDDGYSYCEYCFHKYFVYSIFNQNIIPVEEAETVRIVGSEGEIIAEGYKDVDESFSSYYVCNNTDGCCHTDECCYINIDDLTPDGINSLRYATDVDVNATLFQAYRKDRGLV